MEHLSSTHGPSSQTTTDVSREQLKHSVFQNRRIADISRLREHLLTHFSQAHGGPHAPRVSPIALQLQNRTRHLRPFAPFFQRLLDPHSPSARMRSLTRNLQIAAQLGWKAQDFRHIPSVFDARFNDPNDLIEPLFAAIFQDREAGLLRQWMAVLDTQVETVSAHLLATIDRAARVGCVPLRREVVLIGGGPLTSIIASILGAFFHVTVITEQRGLGKPWRNRPIYINSSALIADFQAAPLPLLGGGTTRVIGQQQLNNLDISLLLGTDTKRVRCDDGSEVEYIAGQRLGDLVATNIVFNADDYLIDQQVDVSNLQQTAQGNVRLVLIDTETGRRRELDASAVFVLSGPGNERTLSPVHELETHLHQVRTHTDWQRDALRRLEAEPATPGIQTERQWLRERMAQTPVDLPRVLSLTAIEKLYEWWEDGGAEPAQFPLRDLFAQGRRIAYIGNGDTMRTLKELVEGRGPERAYPEGFPFCNPGGRSTIYNESATSPQEYDRATRRRYQGTYTATTAAIPFKARRARVLTEQARVEVIHDDDAGRSLRRRYSYVFACTGLDRRSLAAHLPAAPSLQKIRDLEGVVVACGNGGHGGTAGANLFIAGAATGFTTPDFPQEIQTILEAIAIDQNTISLWVNGLLAERLAYSYAATHCPTKGLLVHEQ